MQRDLVERAMSGDHDAFSELARVSARRLFTVARLILRDDARAEDATKEALVAAGNFLRAIVHLNYDAWISANGNTIVERDTWNDFYTADGSRVGRSDRPHPASGRNCRPGRRAADPRRGRQCHRRSRAARAVQRRQLLPGLGSLAAFRGAARTNRASGFFMCGRS